MSDWDAALDNCLINAAAMLAESVPENFEERMGLAYGWMNLADTWIQRQDNEAKFEHWRDEHEYEDA